MSLISQILAETQVIAIVGCSDKMHRTSYQIAAFLQRVGYRVIPVNPRLDHVLGETCYPSVSAIPAEIRVDLVDIFRQPRYTEAVVEDILMRKAQTNQAPVVWTQLGVSAESARQLAESNGLVYIPNRCTLVEYERYA